MGISTDAILCYGFQIYDEEKEIIEEKLENFDSDNYLLHDKYNLIVITHCHSEYPEYILAASDSAHEAYRGHPEELGQEIKSIEQWRNDLLQFCSLSQIGINFREPQWLLCSYWG